MKIRLAADLQTDSIVDGLGIRTVIWTQGCIHNCPGCHNQDMWDFEGGYEFTSEVRDKVIAKLNENGVLRNLCIIGGEPLCPENIELTISIVTAVRAAYPDITIFLWTGYTFNALPLCDELTTIISKIDYLIEGPYIEELRDITLPLIGSTNQNIIHLT